MRVTPPPYSAKEKALLRRAMIRSKGIMAPHSMAQGPRPSEAPKVREFTAPTSIFFVPRKPRGASGCRMSHEKRLAVLARHQKRVAFFAELGVVVS